MGIVSVAVLHFLISFWPVLTSVELDEMLRVSSSPMLRTLYSRIHSLSNALTHAQ